MEMFSDVELSIVNNTIYLKGLPAKTIVKDFVKIYKYDQNKGEEFFRLIVSGFLIQRVTISFHRYFSLEVYAMFEKLFQITERSFYKDTLTLLINNDEQLRKYLTPPIEVPNEITERLNNIPLELYPYQKAFLKILYNSIHKLNLRGNINAFGTGMGKTASVVACIYALNAMPAIITAPKSTLDSSWKQTLLKLIPGLKHDEVQLIHSFNLKKKWKFLITNYERLNQAYQLANTAAGKVQTLIIDESHNFRYLNTARSQNLIEIVEGLDIKTVIPISGTPIKAKASEIIPIVKLLDPNFTDDVIKVFKKMYGKDQYSTIISNVLTKRLSIYIDREVLDEKTNEGFPSQEEYVIDCTISNPTPYYLSTIKKDLKDRLDKEIPVYAKKQKPNFEHLKELIKNIPEELIPNDTKYDYISLVKIRMTAANGPPDERMREILIKIRSYELSFKKILDPELYKEIVATRKMCTSWLNILMGKLMGELFIKRKIECISKIVKENADKFAEIINKMDLKTIIFGTYAQPLQDVIDALKKYKLNGLLITGGMDSNSLLKQFYTDNSIDFLSGSLLALSTGTDGMQKYANCIIFINKTYRETDMVQARARIYRRGATSKVVYFYYLRLVTEEKNLIDNESEILEWSKNMFDTAMDLDGENPQGTLQEKIDRIFQMINVLDE